MLTTVTFVLFPIANQYICRSITSVYIEQNILLCSAVGVCNTNTVAENVSSLHPNHLLPALAGSRQRP